MTSGSLQNFYRGEVEDAAKEVVANRRLKNTKITISKSFAYKTKIIWRTPTNNRRLNTKVVVPLKYLSNFGYLLIYL